MPEIKKIVMKNLLKVWLTGTIMISLLFVFCERKFDPIVIGEDILSPGEVRNIKVIENNGSITLSWLAPIDFDLVGYIVSYTPNGSGEINLGKVNQLVVDSLENDIEYTFTISSIDLAGNISKGVTIIATPKMQTGTLVSFTEDFNSSCPTGLPAGWVSFSASSNNEWECVDIVGNYALQGNNYGADVAANDWLITPGIDLPFGHRTMLNFKYATNYSDAAGFGLAVVISTNYSGSGDPNAATWTTLNAGINNGLGTDDLVDAAEVSLSGYTGTVYVAFRYTSSGNVTTSGAAVQARLDDVSIVERVFQNFPFSEDFDSSCPTGLPTGWISFSASNNTEWECVDPQNDGNYAVQGNNYGADVAANDWLITPGIDLPFGHRAMLNFKYATNYSDAAGFGLAVVISTDYSGSGDPNAATWTPLNAGINNALNSSALVNSTPVSLSAYSGVVYVAFRYTSSGNVTTSGAAVQARLDDVSIVERVFQNFPFSEDFDSSCPTGLPTGWISSSASNNTEWECVDPQNDGNYAVQGNNYGADVAANDWLITPAIELPASNNAQLKFKYSTEFSDAAGFGLAVVISTDYSGSGDPNAATWTPLNAGINNALNSSAPVNSTPVSLSAYSGIVYVAFRYTSSGNVTTSGAAVRVRLFDVDIQ